MNDTPGPGKFEACLSLSLAEALYECTLDSGWDECFGTVDDVGWHAIIRHYEGKSRHFIVKEDTQGFFYYREFSDLEDANLCWKQTINDYTPVEENA